MRKATNNLRIKVYGIASIAGIIGISILGKLFLQPNETNSIMAGTRKVMDAAMANLISGQPLRFIENQGQAGDEAKYHVQGAGHTVLFCEDKIVLRKIESATEWNNIVLQFEGANPNPVIEGVEKLAGVAHFYKNPDPNQWQTNVPTYGSVLYKDLYPGINMAYIGDDGKLESEFYVSPGADYHQIRLNYQGIKSKKIREGGALVLETELGELIEKNPLAYQEIDGARTEVKAQYILLADANIGFELGSYNHEFPVVIDPELIFITTIVGQFGGGEFATGVVLDSAGNLILSGAANRFFPVTDIIDGSNHANGLGNDGSLIKLDGSSGEVIYSAIFGGSKTDYFNDVAIDSSGNLYLTGLTSSTDFPVLNPAQATTGGGDDAFLVILNSAGELTYSSYLGGSKRDWGEGIALDDSGNIYIGGRTESSDFPIVNGFQTEYQGGTAGSGFPSDNFIAKFNAAGNVVYATYLGGTGNERFTGIAVNNSGQATIAGGTTSTDFPLMNAYQATLGGVKFSTGDIFVTRLNSSGNGLIYSSYFGGAVQDRAGDIALGVDGTAYVTGGTSSLDFPIVNGQSFPEADSSDGILIRLDNFGQPVYSVRTNRPGYDEFEGVAVDDSGAALLVGAWNDTIRVYEKAENDSLKNIFEIAAPGHSINAVQFADGFLAFAGTFFPPELNETKRFENDINAKGAQSGSQKSGGLLRIIDLFDIRIIDFGGVIDRLEIVIKKANADGLKVGTDENGKVTINGVSTGINADDVDDIKVIGSDGADCIDLRCVTFENFIGINPSFTGITVEAGGGNDKVIGSADFKNWIFGGDGDDEIQGGDKDDTLHGEDGKDVIFGRGGADFIDGGKEDDRLFGGEGKDDIVGGPGNDLLDGGGEGDFLDGGEGSDNLFGGDGNDTILFDAEDELVKGEKGNDTLTFLEIFFDNKNLNKNGAVVSHEGAVVIADISGVDTLDFAGYDVAISLDLGLLNSPQIIDSTGTQVMLEGIFEVILGTEFDDEISVSPLPDTMRFVDGGGGTDVLNFESGEAQGVDDGSTITTPGFADVAYVNIETVNLSFVSSVRESDTSIPINFSLGNNYPNPFNPSTLIEYSLPEASHVSLKIYNALGQKVLTLVDKQQKAGRFSATFNAKALPSGLYFYSIKAGNYISVKKMLLLK